MEALEQKFSKYWTVQEHQMASLCLPKTPTLGPGTCGLLAVWVPGACFSKAPINTGPDNLPGRLTGNFTGPEITFLKAPVNFPGTYRAW